MKVSIIGTGYVGLVTGACLAGMGHRVVCMDTDTDKILRIRSGILPIYEPGLKELITTVPGKLEFTDEIQTAVHHGDIILIAVGTPSMSDGKPCLDSVFAAARDIARYLSEYKVIVTKSTVPVGTGRQIKTAIEEKLAEEHRTAAFDIASNPEFLREGSAVRDFMHPERIVIGAESKQALDTVKALYAAEDFRSTPMIATSLETAEMVKYASNAFLAAKISFINEIAVLCELCGADVVAVSKAMGLDSRIGSQFLNPGAGFGGSCFPKDILALLHTGRQLGYVPQIIKSTMTVNQKQLERSVKKIKQTLRGIKHKTVTILGLSFKPETDDIREAPAVFIIRKLLASGVNVRVYDPQAMYNVKQLYPELPVVYCRSAWEACTGSDCIALITEWAEFRSLDWQALRTIVKTPQVLDLRNVFDPEAVRQAGFRYEGVGRK